MPEDELEQVGSQEGQEPMVGPGPEVNAGEAEAQPEITLQDLHKNLQNLQREFGRVRGLQSQFDSLPKTIDKTLSERLEAMKKDQYLNSLTPEDRLGYQQQQEGQKQLEAFFEKFLEQKAPGLLGKYGDFSKTFERISGQLESQDYFDQVAEALGEDAQKAIPAITAMFKELKAKSNSADPAEADQALKLRSLYAQNPHAAAMAAMRRMQAETQGAANGFIDQRRGAASKSATVPRGGQGKAPARLSKEQMNDFKYMEQLAGNMSTEEYEKLLQNSRA